MRSRSASGEETSGRRSAHMERTAYVDRIDHFLSATCPCCLAGSVRRVFTAVAEPRWSPDGSTLAWVAAEDGVPGLFAARFERGPAIAWEGALGRICVAGTRGGTWAWVDDDRVVVVDGDGRLCV